MSIEFPINPSNDKVVHELIRSSTKCSFQIDCFDEIRDLETSSSITVEVRPRTIEPFKTLESIELVEIAELIEPPELARDDRAKPT